MGLTRVFPLGLSSGRPSHLRNDSVPWLTWTWIIFHSCADRLGLYECPTPVIGHRLQRTEVAGLYAAASLSSCGCRNSSYCCLSPYS